MARRRRNRSTTIDEFPNFLTGTITTGPGGPNTFITVSVPTPIPRLTTTGGRSTVMELLWMDVDFRFSIQDPNEEVVFEMITGTTPTALVGWEDPRTLMFLKWKSQGFPDVLSPQQFTFALEPGPFRYDWQTRDGKGFLLPSDKFHVSIQGSGLAGVSVFTCGWRLFYRFVEIPIAEFVGIVQSFQST